MATSGSGSTSSNRLIFALRVEQQQRTARFTEKHRRGDAVSALKMAIYIITLFVNVA